MNADIDGHRQNFRLKYYGDSEMTLEGRVFLLDDAAFTVTKILLKSHILIKIIYKKNHMKKAILI